MSQNLGRTVAVLASLTICLLQQPTQYCICTQFRYTTEEHLFCTDPVNHMFIAVCCQAQPIVHSQLLHSSVHCSFNRRSVPAATTVGKFFQILLILSGDAEPNPRPGCREKYPCGYCGINVTWSRLAVVCDECSMRYHKSCYSMSDSKYDNIVNEPWSE